MSTIDSVGSSFRMMHWEVVFFSLKEQEVRNSLTRFLLMISVWTGLNSGLELDREPRLLEVADDGMDMEAELEAEEAMEDACEE